MQLSRMLLELLVSPRFSLAYFDDWQLICILGYANLDLDIDLVPEMTLSGGRGHYYANERSVMKISQWESRTRQNFTNA